MLEHMYFRKLGDLAQADLYYKMESVGSTLIASTYRDFIKFTMKVAPVYLKTCWGIMETFLKSQNGRMMNLYMRKGWCLIRSVIGMNIYL